MNQLIISGYSIEIALRRFTSRNFPRERPQSLSFSESRNGSTLLNGPSFEPKHIWQISAIVTEPQIELIRALHDLFQQSPTALVLTDTIARFNELSPRTRPLAPGTSVTTIASRVAYFAQFNAGFNSPLTVVESGNYYQADFQLKELAKRLAS